MSNYAVFLVLDWEASALPLSYTRIGTQKIRNQISDLRYLRHSLLFALVL